MTPGEVVDLRRGARMIRLVGALLLLLAAAPAFAGGNRQMVVIDDDNGFGLMHVMLLRAPQVEVLGLTTVSGDMWVNRGTAMALRGLELVGRTDVAVAAGARVPLINSEAVTERWEALYGKLTWKGAWTRRWAEPTRQGLPAYHGPDDPVDLPWGNPKTRPTAEIAANFLIRMVHLHPGAVTIVATGPMTNLALAQRLDPDFARLAKALVYMGGSLNPRQLLQNPSAAEFAREFANSPRREFNVRFDPEAASIVARSPWRRIVAVPVDATTGSQLTPALLKRLGEGAPPGIARIVAGLESGFPLWDELAAAIVIDPTLVTRRQRLFLDVDTQSGPSYGDMLSWSEGYQPGLGEQPADVVEAVDVPRVEALMVRLVRETKR